MRNDEDNGQVDEGGIVVILVGTRSGTHYLIDLHAMRLKRLPATGGDVLTLDDGRPVSQPLRRDQQWLKIIHLGPLSLGRRLEIHLEPLGDPHRVAFTSRLTTEVVSITAVEPPPAETSETAVHG